MYFSQSHNCSFFKVGHWYDCMEGMMRAILYVEVDYVVGGVRSLVAEG